jgi:3',5'-cyclic AMP phosphodiesterase CpdA
MKKFLVTTMLSSLAWVGSHLKMMIYAVLWIAISMMVSCVKEKPLTEKIPIGKGGPGNSGQLKIAIVSDIHYMSSSLLKNNAASGVAFQAYLDQDPKLIEFSDPIFRQCMKQVIAEKPDMLLIPGDLTKDGEKVSHQDLLKLLNQFDLAHIKVFVVPGNHDVNNPESAQYDGDNATPAPSISAADFAGYYARYGYDHAISRDSQVFGSWGSTPAGMRIMKTLPSWVADSNRKPHNGPCTGLQRPKKGILFYLV